MYVENQGYIHYRKGSLAMYALRDYIGEDAINRALRGFIERHAFLGPPFPAARDLVAAFRAEAGPEHQRLITELFEKIVLFDLKVTDAQVTQGAEGGCEVSMTIEARRLEADGSGRETEAPLDYRLDVGVFPAAGPGAEGVNLPAPLVLEKHRIVSGTNELTFHVEEPPGRVGIDPYNKMIDRNPDDNLRRL